MPETFGYLIEIVVFNKFDMVMFKTNVVRTNISVQDIAQSIW